MTNTPYNREQAARRAELNTHNQPGLCQLWTRNIFGAPAVGDIDHDGDSDAVDGWKSEIGHQHPGDTNPPRGVPLAWSGGKYGHRAVSLGNQRVRSIDINGQVGTVSLFWFGRNWGLHYLGWSDTMSGWLIPKPPVTTIPARKSNLQIAREVIAGQWGVGADRVARLTKAGYNAATIQALVNSLLS
jgi:hypothetical protein